MKENGGMINLEIPDPFETFVTNKYKNYVDSTSFLLLDADYINALKIGLLIGF